MKIRPTLHFSILTLFFVFLLVSAGTLTWFNYKENSRAALAIADDLLTEVDAMVRERVVNMFKETLSLAREASELPQLSIKPQFLYHGVQWYLAESLLVHPHVYSVYIGYSDGDFYQLISLRHAKEALRRKLQAPDKADLAVRRVFARPSDGRRVELWQYLDSERRMVGSRTMDGTLYDPRYRPWFKKAMQTEGVTSTDYYVFTSTESIGLTMAQRFDGPVPGAFGVDITLDDLSEFFARQRVGKSGIVFMFDAEGKLTAHTDASKTVYLHSYHVRDELRRASLEITGDPLLAALARATGQGVVPGRMVLDVEGRRHLVRISGFEEGPLGEQYIAVAAPMADFTESMDNTRRISLYFALGICILAIPMAVYFSRLIARPLRLLSREADEIRHFNLESPVDVSSPIAEISELTKAVKTMKSSLSTFGRYVPKALVQEILLKRLSPDLGGERREVTLLFTDIADFTSITENMDPEQLMLNMSEYLQVTGVEILNLGGTIDKFIGDAIMAFWNAPNMREEHATIACEAALRARHASSRLNDRWAARGLPALRTRFGLHTGEVVVGNVGSEDRMNYTVIGPAVNLASRLEGLNKYYGTSILVSETVQTQARGQYLFRSVGKVMPKGTSVPVKVYELLGAEDENGDLELAAPVELFSWLHDWEAAHAAYLEQRFEEAERFFEEFHRLLPHDVLAATMLGKARQYRSRPPGEGWDGVDVFNKK